MNFNYRITTPANTLKVDAKETEAKLIEGTIKNITVFFPPGHKGLSYCAIFDGEIQIFPTNLGSYYSIISTEFPTKYRISRPWKLTIKTYNLDDAYDHDILIRITLEPFSLLTKESIIQNREKGFLSDLADFFRRFF